MTLLSGHVLTCLLFLSSICFAESLQARNVSATLSRHFFYPNSSLPHFGLRSAYNWETLFSNITDLNENVDRKLYRLVLLGRHGQGYHNVGESKYGSTEWNDKWSRLNGDMDLVWGPDANLTALGKQQADAVLQRWKHESMSGLPWPVIKYSSPLSRTLSTAQLSLNISDTENIYVLENLRETVGIHTCDQRSTRSIIAQRFPFVHFENGFPEEDPLWTAELRESDETLQARATLAFEQIMSEECELALSSSPSTEIRSKSSRVISVTSHSGFIRNLLAVLGHDAIQVPTAGIVALMLEAQCTGTSETSYQDMDLIEDDIDEIDPYLEQDDVKRIFLVQGIP